MDQGLKVTVSADVQQLAGGMQVAQQSVQDLEKELFNLGRVIDNAIAKGENIAPLEAAFDSLNAKIKQLKASAAAPVSGGAIAGVGQQLTALQEPLDSAKSGFGGLGLSLTQSRVAFTDLGRIVTGQGFSLRALSANFVLLGPAVTIAAAAIYGLYEILTKQTDAQKKAEEEAKKLHDLLLNLKDAGDISLGAAGGEEGSIARVQALAAAVQDSNKTYAERKNALDQLRETNKAYFGDLTLEASSLATLAGKVQEYSKALIAEAVVKGQVEEIAKISSEYEKQAHALDVLRDARDRAKTGVGSAKDLLNKNASLGYSTDQPEAAFEKAITDASKAKEAFEAQQEVVDKLSTAIATYKGVLNQAIAEQLQLKPLKDPGPQKDDLKSIIPILEQIKKIYEEIGKPSKERVFQLFDDSQDENGLNIIRTQIREAIKKGATDGANDPELRQAYADLATALQAKLEHVQNPDLHAHVLFDLADPAKNTQTEIESKLEKAFGTKGLELKIPVHLSEEIQASGNFDKEDQKKIEDALKKDPGLAKFYVTAPLDVKFAIDQKAVQDANRKQLQELVAKLKSDVVAAGFKDIGIAIGDALSGAKNPLQKAVQDFTTILGNGLIQIGEQMIASSSMVAAIKDTLGTLFEFPEGGIAQGIAAVALGELVKNVGAHAFATGGIVTGPTFGMVGEAGPEVIFPLDRLNRFIKSNTGGGPMEIKGNVRLSGRDLSIALSRDNKLQNLTS
jgi:hypothetical protein